MRFKNPPLHHKMPGGSIGDGPRLNYYQNRSRQDLDKLRNHGHFHCWCDDALLLAVDLIEAQVVEILVGLRKSDCVGLDLGKEGRLVLRFDGARLHFDQFRSSYGPLALEIGFALKLLLGPDLLPRISWCAERRVAA
jgi:hypothetical protein